jgi:hypothetical protein
MDKWETKPTWQQVSGEGPEVKYYWARWEQLKKKEGLWWYQWHDPTGKISEKVLIPHEGREEILQEHHNNRIAGHFGATKTYHRLRKSPYIWPKMKQEAQEWCRLCDLCARTKPPLRKMKAPMGGIRAGITMERIAIDVLGPLPETEDKNKYIIVMGDYFTKWIEAYAVPDHTAETVALYLVTDLISRFGIPGTIHTDQGREFQSKLFLELCDLLEIAKTRTSPWRPQSDGMIERFNRTLGTMLKQVTADHQKDWDTYLPFLCMAYRSTQHETTGYTPNMMMLGRELPMPSYLLLSPPGNDDEKAPGQYVKELQQKLQEVHQVAREKLERGHVKQKKQYDKGAQVRKWKEGQAVWLYNPTKTVGRSPKLTIFWEAQPYVITKVISDVIMKIQRNTGSKPRVVHVDRLISTLIFFLRLPLSLLVPARD